MKDQILNPFFSGSQADSKILNMRGFKSLRKFFETECVKEAKYG